jgi:protein-tyrosine phosphatase
MPSAALSIARQRPAAGSNRPGQRLPLEGVLNLRDVGGYHAAGGRILATGRVFRADSLGQATERDVEALGRLGLRLVCDLRSDEEVGRLPDRLPAGVALERNPMLVNPNVLADYTAPDFDWDAYRIERMYIDMLDRCGETFRRIFARLAHAASYPFVFHCSGGKDRTGMVAALLLRVLGVADAAIVADYALSERYIRPKVAEFRARLQREGRNPRGAERLFHSPPEAMVRALAYLDACYGTTERYLASIGVPRAHLAAFRRAMLA